MKLIYPNDWILNRVGKELEGLDGQGTYFINYYLYDEEQPRPHGALFTHCEPKHQQKWDEVKGKVDYAVCLNRRVKEELESEGIPTKQIKHGYDPRVKKEITFGVVGRVYGDTGRKGEYLVKNMIDAGYNVIGWGEGWACRTEDDWDELPQFYQDIDYLIVTSLIEGGPVPVLDAIAAGVPVIAPIGVGWCDEFPCIRYKKGDWLSLNNILDKLVNPPSWKNWREKHQSLFESSKMNTLK